MKMCARCADVSISFKMNDHVLKLNVNWKKCHKHMKTT